MSDWNGTGQDDGRADDDLLSDVDWSGAPAYVPTEPAPPAEPVAERVPAGRRASAATRGQGSHSMGMRMSRGAFWGFVVLALAIGLGIGGGVLVWQRTQLLSNIRTLETRLSATEASMTASADQLAGVQTQLAASEASVADLTTQNTQLTSDLASATAALAAAKTSGTVTITERTVSPTSVETSHTLTLQVKVQGTADKVQMRIVGTGSVSSYGKVYNLTKSTTSGDIVTWKRSVTAPGKVGVYRYYATAYVGTKKTEMPGVSAWTFQVK